MNKQQKREKRHKKIRARISGTKEKPRLFVFRSDKHIYAQIIDDDTAKVLLAASDKEVKKTEKKEKGGKTNIAFQVGKIIAKKAAEKSIEKVVFDRGGFIFHGRIKALAEGAREGGLKF
ncbi:MAG: 50S ribosomal protein L18 [Candidatus Staskawiczbacteria bacterium]|nr:50S ribosomal protein L18 [Candidatus Staskawiczbacteria bacterium]